MKTPPYILVGAGGFGREVDAWLRVYSPDNAVLGFVDDIHTGPRILGSVRDHAVVPGARYVVCLGNGADRIRLGAVLAARGAQPGTIVAPMGDYASDAAAAEGGIFLGKCSLSSNLGLGPYVLVQGFACIGHDVVLGAGVTVGSHAFIGGATVVGDHATIHPHATVLPKLRIGRGAIVGAGAVVVKDVPDHVTVFGNPAKVIAVREPGA